MYISFRKYDLKSIAEGDTLIVNYPLSTVHCSPVNNHFVLLSGDTNF